MQTVFNGFWPCADLSCQSDIGFVRPISHLGYNFSGISWRIATGLVTFALAVCQGFYYPCGIKINYRLFTKTEDSYAKIIYVSSSIFDWSDDV